MHLTLLTRYPDTILSSMILSEDIRGWYAERVKGIFAQLHVGSSTPAVFRTEQGRYYSFTRIQNADDVTDIRGQIQDIVNILTQEIGYWPIVYYLCIGSGDLRYDSDWDSIVEEFETSLILVSENDDKHLGILENLQEVRRNIPVGNGVFAVSTDPVRAWLDQNRSVLKQQPDRSSTLEYDPNYEQRLPLEIQEERKELDQIGNGTKSSGDKVNSPLAIEINLQKGEKAEKACLRGYRDIAIGKKKAGNATLGGRSLLVACNLDANLVGGWRAGDSSFLVHNASSLHFKTSAKKGSLPEAILNGNIILRKAWITGSYTAPPLPEPLKNSRMVWNPEGKSTTSKKKGKEK